LQAQQPPTLEELTRRAYVRRVSAGATLTVAGLGLLKGGEDYLISDTPPFEIDRFAEHKRHYVGGGVTLQVAIVERVALNLSALYRKAEYTHTTTQLSGVDNPITVIDDRTQTSVAQWTRVRYVDIPVLARIYNKRRHDAGNRMFVQIGPSMRRVWKVFSNYTNTAADGNRTWDYFSRAPFNNRMYGATAGFGGQLIDPVGVRVIPEFRYTRWMGEVVGSAPARTDRNQFEFLFSLTF
jgi:hypothetical protein